MNKSIYLLPILLIFLLIIGSNNLSAQYQDGNVKISFVDFINSEKELKINNDTIEIKIIPTDYFWKITIYNVTNKLIEVDWDKAIFSTNNESSKVVFNDDDGWSIDQPKSKDRLLPKTRIQKKIMPRYKVTLNKIYPTYKEKYLKKKPSDVAILIPMILDEKECPFLIKIKLEYFNSKKSN